jgi:hypothetical protein
MRQRRKPVLPKEAVESRVRAARVERGLSQGELANWA